MKTYSEKYDKFTKELHQEIISHIAVLIRQHGEKSKFRNEQVLNLQSKNYLPYIGEGDRCVVEVSSTDLIDEYGYSYNFHCLSLDQLCKIADSFL